MKKLLVFTALLSTSFTVFAGGDNSMIAYKQDPDRGFEEFFPCSKNGGNKPLATRADSDRTTSSLPPSVWEREMDLIKAIQEEDINTIKTIVQEESVKDTAGSYVLAQACKKNLAIVKLLSQNNFPGKEEGLIESAKLGLNDIVSYLLEQKTDIHSKKNSALRSAAEEGHDTTVKLLLTHGANINAGEPTALQLSAQNCHLRVFTTLLNNSDIDIKANDNFALHWLITTKNIQAFKIDGEKIVPKLITNLISQGIDIHFDNEAVLIWAIENNEIDIVKILINKGACIKNNDFALQMATTDENRIEIVELLLKNGANKHALDAFMPQWLYEFKHSESYKRNHNNIIDLLKKY